MSDINNPEKPQTEPTVEQLYENKQQTFLFVGGPLDGDWRSIHPDQQAVQTMEAARNSYAPLGGFPDEFRGHAYYKIQVHQQGIRKLYVFAHESLARGASYEVWVRLLNGYKVIK